MFTQCTSCRRTSAQLLLYWVLRFSWTVVFATCPLPTLSAPAQVWTTFTPDDCELPHTDILALAHGADGTLWIGTHGGGLARIDKDGHWQTYTAENTKGGLPYDLVLALAPEADGAVWIGTEQGLARIDKDGHWKTYTAASTNGGLPDDSVLSLAFDMDDTLWVGTVSGGLVHRGRDGQWKNYTRASTVGGLPNDNVRRLVFGPDGALWIATGGGVARLDRGGRWQTYTRANTAGGLPSDEVKALAFDADGMLWVGTFGDGLASRDKNEHWQTYNTANTNGGLPNDIIWTLAPGAEGTLWIGTYGGVVRRDKDGRWLTYNTTNTGDNLLSDRIWSLLPGPGDVLWIGTWKGGLTRFDLDRRWQTYTSANTTDGPLSDRVTALTIGADGEVWAGTKGDGLLRRGRGDEDWKTYTTANTNGGLPDDRILALVASRSGALLVGTAGGFARLDSDGRWQTYTTASTNGGLPHDVVIALAPANDGALWIGTQGGLARLDKDRRWQKYTSTSTDGGLPTNDVRALVVAADDTLWIGTHDHGLTRFDKDGRWRTYTRANTDGALPVDDVSALTVSADGVLWIGAYHHGLTRLDRQGHWQTYTTANTNGGLPFEIIQALAAGPGGKLWIGTEQGLARIDKDGHWQAYNTANTSGGLPNDMVLAVSPDDGDGGVWIGTLGGGLAHFRDDLEPSHRIVEVIGERDQVREDTQTVAVVAFDNKYRTDPMLFRYAWRMTESRPLGDTIWDEVTTRSTVYRATFKHDGHYRLQVNALDRNGKWSKPRLINFNVDLPKPNPTHEILVKVALAFVSTGSLYFAMIFPLIPLYPRHSWARTAINSGLFTKFPLAHKAILNTRWARSFVFRRLAENASGTELPKPYIPQSLFALEDEEPDPMTLDDGNEGFMQLFKTNRRALVVARSGTGKSVLLRYLQREVAVRFQRGQRVPAPVLIDLRTHPLSGRKIQDLVRDALRGASVELADSDLDFLIAKGGFLILVDSLNELPDPNDARLFHTFFNQDAGNLVLLASQVNLIPRQDMPVYSLAETTSAQAAKYLVDTVGRDLFAELPQEAQVLARNPQDLALLAVVVRSLGAAGVPTHRAALYREILNQDGALRPLVESGDPLLAVLYGLAFRMVAERRVLRDGQLREWIASEPAAIGDAVGRVMQAMQASRLFRKELVRDALGKEEPVTGFSHELIGKFLASRHVRRMIEKGASGDGIDYVGLTGDELWLDVFYFAIDEIDSNQLLNRFLREILAAGGSARERITAYASKIKEAEVENEVLEFYRKSKLNQDLQLTPAA
jgi:ligand-binding sensor domain-containing protein